jgi:hypothetical protein
LRLKREGQASDSLGLRRIISKNGYLPLPVPLTDEVRILYPSGWVQSDGFPEATSGDGKSAPNVAD